MESLWVLNIFLGDFINSYGSIHFLYLQLQFLNSCIAMKSEIAVYFIQMSIMCRNNTRFRFREAPNNRFWKVYTETFRTSILAWLPPRQILLCEVFLPLINTGIWEYFVMQKRHRLRMVLKILTLNCYMVPSVV